MDCKEEAPFLKSLALTKLTTSSHRARAWVSSRLMGYLSIDPADSYFRGQEIRTNKNHDPGRKLLNLIRFSEEQSKKVLENQNQWTWCPLGSHGWKSKLRCAVRGGVFSTMILCVREICLDIITFSLSTEVISDGLRKFSKHKGFEWEILRKKCSAKLTLPKKEPPFLHC